MIPVPLMEAIENLSTGSVACFQILPRERPTPDWADCVCKVEKKRTIRSHALLSHRCPELRLRDFEMSGLGLSSGLAPLKLVRFPIMNAPNEPVRLLSLGIDLAGVLSLPGGNSRFPVMIICHGAGEFKENYGELCDLLAERGVATLAIDMHGHGQSAGERF